jgi:tRNA pseudouridine55 synthase
MKDGVVEVPVGFQSQSGSVVNSVVACDGILNIRKPDGWTSHDVVNRVRSVLGIQKVGHAGTLDPHATGVLPVLIGKGTRIAQHLVEWDKEYVAILRLGKQTDTQDAWGKVLGESSIEGLSAERVMTVLGAFHGTIQQVPPMFSAVKIGGQPLYKKARKGELVDRVPKTVSIHELDILNLDLPEVTFRVVCSKGTYIRTLCADVGEVLGVGGHLQWLQRTRVGPLHLDDAVSLDALKGNQDLMGFKGGFYGLDQALAQFPVVEVQEDDARRVVHGNAIPWIRIQGSRQSGSQAASVSHLFRVKDGAGRLLALGIGPVPAKEGGIPLLKIDTVFA